MDVARWKELVGVRIRVGRYDMRPDDVRVWDEMTEVILDDLEGALQYFAHGLSPQETTWLFEILGQVIERTQDPRIVPSIEAGLDRMGLLAYEQGLFSELRHLAERYGDDTLKRQMGIMPENPAPLSASPAQSWKQDDPLPEWMWTLVANVVDERIAGEDHHVVHGTKGFSPGTKVYVADEWHVSIHDCGGTLQVIGRPRHGRRLVRMWVRRDVLMNFRVARCHQPQAIKLMAQEWLPAWSGQGDDDRERLEQVADRYRQDHIAERQAQAERDGTLSVTARSLKRTLHENTARFPETAAHNDRISAQ